MITLVPAERHHFDHFYAMTLSAWTHDSNTLFKSTIKGEMWNEADGLEHMNSLFENPRVQIVVAIDDASPAGPAPIGWCSWAYRGFSKDELKESQAFTEEDRQVKLSSPSKEAIERAHSRPPPNVPSMPEMTDDEMKAGKARMDEFEALQDKDMNEKMEELMPEGAKCMYIVGITVSPTAQGTGVGTELVKWGMRRCDKEGTYAWMHASEAARPLFRKLKWDVYHKLEMNLDEYDPRPEGKREGKWGHYELTYFRYPTAKERQAREVKDH